MRYSLNITQESTHMWICYCLCPVFCGMEIVAHCQRRVCSEVEWPPDEFPLRWKFCVDTMVLLARHRKTIKYITKVHLHAGYCTTRKLGGETMSNRHSIFGVISFLMGLGCGAVILACVGYSTYLEMTTPGGIDEQAPEVILIGLAMLGFMGLSILGGAIGFVGLFESESNKLFAILGTLTCAAVFLAPLALIIIGLALK